MERQHWQDWTNLILGVWLFLTPWIFATIPAAAAWNFYGVGAVVAMLAVAALNDTAAWEEWTNVALGAWLVISPWILGYSFHEALTWNAIAVGAGVALVAVSALPESRHEPHTA
ncbi:MAG: SPW repeat protein [Bdellovibrionales bacterium]